MKQSARTLLSTAALLQSAFAQQPSVIGTGTDPECTDALHTIIYEYPAFFSTVYESASTIFNFMGGTNSLVINNPPETVITSTILTTTVITTATTTATVTETPGTAASATLGQGIPSGTQTAIPSTSPFALAYIVDAVGGRRPKGFAGSAGTTSDADAADFFYLEDGELRTLSGESLGKDEGATWALLVPTADDKDITTTFSFVDGILKWESPDKGPATFYECGDNLYAGFPNSPPYTNCTQAVIGGISRAALDGSGSGTTTTTSRSSTTTGSGTSTTTSTGSTTTGSSTSSEDDGSSTTTSTESTTTSGEGGSTTTSSPSGTTTAGDGTSTTTTTGGTTGAGTSTTTDSTTNGGTTTTTSSATTTTTGVATTLCGDTALGTEVDGYAIYCGSTVNAADGSGDLDSAAKDTFEACIEFCEETATCGGLSYARESKICYLKAGAMDAAGSDAGFDSAVKATTGSGTTTTTGVSTTTGTTTGAITTTTAPTTTTTGAATTTTTTAATTTTPAGSALCPGTALGEEHDGYEIYCGYTVDSDQPGDLPESAKVADFAACLQLCDDTNGCTGLSYHPDSTNGNDCYLKGGNSVQGSADPTFHGAVKVASSNTALCPGTPEGEEYDGYEIYCGFTVNSDQPGDLPESAKVNDFAACIQLCDDTNGCTGFSYHPDSTNGDDCYLKGGNSVKGSADPSFDGAVKVGSSPSGPLCPGTPDGEEHDGYKIHCGFTVNSDQAGDLPESAKVADFAACIALCDNTPACKGFSYHTGAGGDNDCYMKGGTVTKGQAVQDFDAAIKIGGTCPRDNAPPNPANGNGQQAVLAGDNSGGTCGTCQTAGSYDDVSYDYYYYTYSGRSIGGELITDPNGTSQQPNADACACLCSNYIGQNTQAKCVSYNYNTGTSTCTLHRTCVVTFTSGANLQSGLRVPDSCSGTVLDPSP